MIPQLRARRLACSFAASMAALALAAPSAPARPIEQFLDSVGSHDALVSCETQVVNLRVPARVPVQSSCEDQAVASRGTGAPAPAKPTEADTFPGLAAEVRDVPRVESADAGFDWASAAIGAATAAGLLALASLAALATSRRSRLRAAR
jgi:hypothetical protein